MESQQPLVLIVDDRTDQRSIFKLMAERLGFAAHVDFISKPIDKEILRARLAHWLDAAISE